MVKLKNKIFPAQECANCSILDGLCACSGNRAEFWNSEMCYQILEEDGKKKLSLCDAFVQKKEDAAPVMSTYEEVVDPVSAIVTFVRRKAS